MANCEFSEFSYGFALTDSLLATIARRIGSAPVFPSLIQEGKAGGGYDVKIPSLPVPIFLQFKIPQVLVRGSKHMPPRYALPYYRMPLRTKYPNQHQMLLTLESAQPSALVLYASPLFHKIDDLDDHFINKRLHEHSAFIEPSRIGTLDDQAHHISYQPNALEYWRHSEPAEIGLSFDFDAIFKKLAERRAKARQLFGGQNVEAENVQNRQRKVLAPLLETLKDITLREEERARSFSPLLPSASVATASLQSDHFKLPEQARRKAIDEKLFATQTTDMALLAKRVSYVAQVNFGLTFALVEAADVAVTLAV